MSAGIDSEGKAGEFARALGVLLEGARRADLEVAEKAEGLSPQEVKVLDTVGCLGCPIMGGIASAIRLSLSSVTGLVDRLCEKRLVRRDRAPDDRRAVQVELTPEGRRIHEAAVRGRLGFARGILEALDPVEKEALVSLLGKVSRRLESSTGSG